MAKRAVSVTRTEPAAKATQKPSLTGQRKLTQPPVTGVRFEPVFRHLISVWARHESRSDSQFIIWAVQEAMKRNPLTSVRVPHGEGPREVPFEEAADLLWGETEAQRLVKLATYLPQLLTSVERQAFARIQGDKLAWFEGGFADYAYIEKKCPQFVANLPYGGEDHD